MSLTFPDCARYEDSCCCTALVIDCKKSTDYGQEWISKRNVGAGSRKFSTRARKMKVQTKEKYKKECKIPKAFFYGPENDTSSWTFNKSFME